MKYIFALTLSVLFSCSFGQKTISPTDEFRITGEVKTERVFRLADIRQLPQTVLGDISIKSHRGTKRVSYTT